MGAFWGAVWSMLLGSAFFVIPGIGPVVAAGPVVAWMIGALEGAVVVGGIGALGAALFSLGIPKDSVIQYETSIKAGKFLLIAHGTAAEVHGANDILQGCKAEHVQMHDAIAPEPVAVKALA
jgi:hypothetical protein